MACAKSVANYKSEDVYGRLKRSCHWRRSIYYPRMTEADSRDAAGQQGTLTAREVLARAFPTFSSEASGSALSQRTSYVISQSVEPRWIVPINTRAALPVLRSWRPQKINSRLQWRVVLLASATGLLSRFPRVARIDAHLDTSYWHGRLAGFSDSWQCVIHVGNASYTRKALIFFLDDTGSVTAVAKVPLQAASGDAILNEARVLRSLRIANVLPRTLFSDEEHGIAAQTWIQGRGVSRAFGQHHIELLSQLAVTGQSTRLCDHRDAIAGCIATLSGSGSPGLALEPELLQRALCMLEDTRQLPLFVEHRDFAPWNLRRLPNGELTLIDWEWANERGLPWQDICHFFYARDYFLHGTGNVWELLLNKPLLQTYVRRFDIPGETLRGLTMHYLLREYCLYQMNAEHSRMRYATKQMRVLLEGSVFEK